MLRRSFDSCEGEIAEILYSLEKQEQTVYIVTELGSRAKRRQGGNSGRWEEGTKEGRVMKSAERFVPRGRWFLLSPR